MDKNIETVITSLLAEKNTGNALSEILKGINDKNKAGNYDTEAKITEETNIKLQKKIDAISSLIPLLSDENAEQAKFIIRILSIAKFITELE